MSKVYGVRPEAAGPRLALDGALDRLAGEGRLTPCQADPDAWISESFRDRAQAAEACAFCPVRKACSVFAIANQEPAAVWGGTDRQFTGKKET